MYVLLKTLQQAYKGEWSSTQLRDNLLNECELERQIIRTIVRKIDELILTFCGGLII